MQSQKIKNKYIKKEYLSIKTKNFLYIVYNATMKYLLKTETNNLG